MNTETPQQINRRNDRVSRALHTAITLAAESHTDATIALVASRGDAIAHNFALDRASAALGAMQEIGKRLGHYVAEGADPLAPFPTIEGDDIGLSIAIAEAGAEALANLRAMLGPGTFAELQEEAAQEAAPPDYHRPYLSRLASEPVESCPLSAILTPGPEQQIGGVTFRDFRNPEVDYPEIHHAGDLIGNKPATLGTYNPADLLCAMP